MTCSYFIVCTYVIVFHDVDWLHISLHSRRKFRCLCFAVSVLCIVRTLPYVYVKLCVPVPNGLYSSYITVHVRIPMLYTLMRVKVSKLLRICHVWPLYYDAVTAPCCVRTPWFVGSICRTQSTVVISFSWVACLAWSAWLFRCICILNVPPLHLLKLKENGEYFWTFWRILYVLSVTAAWWFSWLLYCAVYWPEYSIISKSGMCVKCAICTVFSVLRFVSVVLISSFRENVREPFILPCGVCSCPFSPPHHQLGSIV